MGEELRRESQKDYTKVIDVDAIHAVGSAKLKAAAEFLGCTLEAEDLTVTQMTDLLFQTRALLIMSGTNEAMKTNPGALDTERPYKATDLPLISGRYATPNRAGVEFLANHEHTIALYRSLIELLTHNDVKNFLGTAEDIDTFREHMQTLLAVRASDDLPTQEVKKVALANFLMALNNEKAPTVH